MILSLKVKSLVFIVLLLPIFFIYSRPANMIAMIGTGYVGLVSGACLADIGNYVMCVDKDSQKIENLNQGIMPIYEQGLDAVVKRNVDAGRLCFTDDIVGAINAATIIFIAVGTPMSDDGSADLSYVYDVIKSIAENISEHKIIVTKSTVPVGTGKKLRAQLEQTYGIDSHMFSIASNPEFLREGIAVEDFLNPDRLVIGTDSDAALVALCQIYEPLISVGVNYVLTDIATAEMIKYASNGFLAVKISYINDIANLCDELEADAKTVAYAMGLDHRISPYFLNSGPGFGGSCFPKDAQALLNMAYENNLSFYMIQAALDVNKDQQKKPVHKLMRIFHDRLGQDLNKKKVAVLGLAFKPNTDDIRYSPSITTINLLLEHGVEVVGYDPVAIENMRQQIPSIEYFQSAYDAVQNADAAIIMTAWDEIKQLDFEKIKKCMKQPVIVDAHNIINPSVLKQLGFICDTIGQSYLCKKQQDYVRTLMPIRLRKCISWRH